MDTSLLHRWRETDRRRRGGHKEYQGAEGKRRIEGKFTERKRGRNQRAERGQPGGEVTVYSQKVWNHKETLI